VPGLPTTAVDKEFFSQSLEAAGRRFLSLTRAEWSGKERTANLLCKVSRVAGRVGQTSSPFYAIACGDGPWKGQALPS